MDLTPYFELRIKEIMAGLGEHCGEYAVAEERRKFLYEAIEPVIKQSKEITITPGDCLNIMDYIDAQNIAFLITQQQLYRHGFFDCVSLLSSLGFLP